MDSSYQHDKPLLDEENSSQVNTLEYTGDGSVCIRGHPALRKHTGNWKGSSLAIGYGAQCPCISSFGADQFDDTDENERTKKSSFFNWTYFVANAGSLISGTVIVWVQDHKGFGTFIFGSSMYRFQKPGGSPLARICQVVVAAIHKRDKDLPCDSSVLYEFLGQSSAIEGSRKLEHTTGLK
uniref:Uncharacterized protein n=1 Tax=Oryza meridionalis TaxID=40149 RepID=A0A0E0CXM2_9ORYZ